MNKKWRKKLLHKSIEKIKNFDNIILLSMVLIIKIFINYMLLF